MGSRRYKGKYSSHKPVRRMPLASWLLILLAVISVSTGAVVAYLSATTDAVTNKFVADTPEDPQIAETFQGNVKSDVSVDVGNPGYGVYVRAAIVATWKDKAEGNVLGTVPVLGTDYTLTLGSDWTKGDDGFYYYPKPVTSGKTPVLIESCEPLRNPPESGYALNVEILTQTVQALGTTDGDSPIPAVQDAWGIDLTGN